MDTATFFQLSPLAQCCLTKDFQLVQWNHAFEKLTGCRKQGPRRFFKYLVPAEQQQMPALLTALKKGQTVESTFTLLHPSGHKVSTSWRWLYGEDDLYYASQLPGCTSAQGIQAQETRQLLPFIPTESLQNLLHQSSDMIARFDHQLRYTFVNKQLLTQTRALSEEQILGRTTKELAQLLGVSEENFTRWMADLQQVLDTGQELMHYDSLKLPDYTLHFETKMFPEYTAGKRTGVLVITRIMNELKHSEERLKEQENVLKMVFDCMQEGVVVIDMEQKFVLTNQKAQIVLGLDQTPAITGYQSWVTQVEAYFPDQKTLIPLDEYPIQQALKGNTVHEQLIYFKLKKAQSGLFLSINANPLADTHGKLIGAVVVFHDVSDRIRAQQQVLSSLATLKGIIESTPDLVVAIDTDYTILTVNSPARESFRRSVGKSIARDTNLLSLVADLPAVAERLKATWARALKGESYVLMHELESENKGTKYYESVYSPILNEKGKILGATMIGRDVTLKRRQENEIKGLLNRLLHLNQQLEEKNKALLTSEEELSAMNEELRSQQEELKQTVDELASRNFELDQLVYKTSHDIRSPLTSILGLVNVMKAEKDVDQWPVYLNHIENRILTLDRFVQSMINYAKANRGILDMQPIDFTKIVEQTKHDLAYMKGYESLTINLQCRGGEVVFRGDLFRLQILFNNIISNAIKYQNPYAEKHLLDIAVHLTPQQAEIVFTDNGIGIKEDHKARIFDMFYRATEHTDGSGLGLYIVKQTVERMKGKISLKSIYGQMTQFVVHIPNSEE